MTLPSAIDLLEHAAERLRDELEHETGALPFATADGLLVLAWLSALSLRMLTEALVVERGGMPRAKGHA
jgi:hypothetical protein